MRKARSEGQSLREGITESRHRMGRASMECVSLGKMTTRLKRKQPASPHTHAHSYTPTTTHAGAAEHGLEKGPGLCGRTIEIPFVILK